MKASTRRSFLASQAIGICCLEAAQSGGGAKEQFAKWPKEIAGVRIVYSKYTKLAAEALLDTSPAYLVNHAMRTFFFGALSLRQEKKQYDGEIAFIASALHDLGLTDKYAGPLPFEIQGAQAARELLSKAGFAEDRTQVVWDGIAMHCLPMASFKPPDIYLVASGAGVDVVGGGLDQLAPGDVKAVLAAFPRLEFKERFVQGCGEIAKKFPRATKGTFMRDIAERTNPQYSVRNICDAIKAAPFSD